jgi:PAS domain S-box-containing protein
MSLTTRPGLAGGRRHWSPERLRRLLLTAILLFTATAATFFGLIVYEHMKLPEAARDNMWWSTNQVERERTKLVHLLRNLAEAPTAASRQKTVLAYDLLYNRLQIMADGDFARTYAGSADVATPLTAVRDGVFALAPQVDALQPESPAGADAIADALDDLEEPLEKLLGASAIINAAQIAEQRAATMRRYVWLGALLVGVIVSVGLFIVLLVNQLRVIGSAHRDLESVIDRAADGVFAIGADGTVGYANPAAERMFGCTAGDMVGRPAVELLPALSGDLLAPGKAQDATHELQGRNHQGDAFDIELSVGEGSFGSGGQYVVFMRDVSARKRSEAATRHKQKLEMIGQLAGGVAHDFNNLLMIVDGYSRRALRLIDNRDEASASLNEVLKASQHGTGLTRQLLSFGGKRALDLRTVRLSDAVEQAASLLRPSLGERCTIAAVETDPNLCVETDPAELTHALLNIGVNARDAMPNGGEIAIRVEACELAEGEVASLPAGRYARIGITDQGTGMDEATLNRIFEPFFTTKEEGRGTGLGLAMVYGFVQQSRGAVTAKSALGQGTTFYLHLPLCATGPAEFAVAADVPRGSGETILLAEDNPPILRLARSMLEGLGYNVLAAEDGITALELESGHEGPIALLLTDVVMPSVSGIEVAAILREARPDMKVLFMSGYPGKGDAIQPLDLPEGVPLLRKPFRPEDLARAVHDALASQPQPQSQTVAA